MMQARTLVTAGLFLALSGAAAFAQAPTPLGEPTRDWAAFTHSSGGGKVCFALTRPKVMAPSDRNHGEVFFFVSTRKAEGVANEPSFQVGYPLKEGTPAVVDVDGKTFNMFTKGDGAWVENAATEQQLIAAMRAGRKMVIKAQSARGTGTSYEFSLAGVSAAIDMAARGCR
ncbi:hypothetical protein GWI72_18870 [Microvirga tunisiensis]|uniref:Uncharacterized protein n=2 Tax=Pannonibacter tanglangensis TaxID=2750084 RepID=A0ABW9ZLM3_9HYPH|nr:MULTISPECIES: invasion associated locus B family protein [unclassified Pannonibacter]NBN65830.1 hypothetical protein [Pannonibacter sp. XCT-34]NBN80348.1 hypothetical protein [Pannonibacter sp. XCT-53]